MTPVWCSSKRPEHAGQTPDFAPWFSSRELPATGAAPLPAQWPRWGIATGSVFRTPRWPKHDRGRIGFANRAGADPPCRWWGALPDGGGRSLPASIGPQSCGACARHRRSSTGRAPRRLLAELVDNPCEPPLVLTPFELAIEARQSLWHATCLRRRLQHVQRALCDILGDMQRIAVRSGYGPTHR